MAEAVSKGGRAGFVAIVGRPSAGKSTLLNTLCGHKVAITSALPQTTRNRIRGIVNRPAGQLVFIDTPGYHDSERRFNRHMRGLIEQTVRDCELVLYVVDATRRFGGEERALMALVAAHAATLPTTVAVNKIDVAAARQVEAAACELAAALPRATVLRVCAQTGEGTEELLGSLFDAAPAGEPVYPGDYYTDQPPEFRIAEIIRERAIARTHAEVPHSIYVEVADVEVRPLDSGGHQLWIRAFVLVERESQKGILVGKGGEGIREIRQQAQKEIARLFPYRIHLDLRVKVDPNWRRNERVLGRLVT